MNKIKVIRFFLLVFLMATILLTAMSFAPLEESTWKAPPEADKIKNPLKGDNKAWKKVDETYKILCAICHGDKGLGDGIAGIALNPRPANFTLDRVQKQSDGALFWKMTNGKPPMAPYKDTLTEEQRWQLVNYIRHLAKDN